MSQNFFFKHGHASVLVLGDFMVDEYIRGVVSRISPEAPVQIIDIQKKENYLGGAGNVLNNLIALGANVAACGIVGEDESGKWLIDTVRKKDVKVDGLFYVPERPTTVKHRIIASNQQMLRLDHEVREPVSPTLEERIIEYIVKNIDFYDVVIMSDYKKGVLTPKVLKAVISVSRQKGKFVIIDPKGTDYSHYGGANLITPNKKEASLAADIEIFDQDSLLQAGKFLLDTLNLDAVLITRSEEGMSLFEKEHSRYKICHIPTKAREIFDITGAGDTVISTLGLCLASQIPLKESVRIANIAGGISVGKVGTATVTTKEISQEIESEGLTGLRKIKDPDELLEILGQLKKIEKRVVYTMGCFDLLKLDQIRFLEQSRCLGDYLVVGLYSDNFIKSHLGNGHPYIREEERIQVVAALDSVSYVTMLDDAGSCSFVDEVRPHVLTESTDPIRLNFDKRKKSMDSSNVKIVTL